MILHSDGSAPIYVQISEWLENEIIRDAFMNDEKVYSQYQLAEMFNINPATAAKGLNILVESQILYKKRGLGMFVVTGAKKEILRKRKSETLKEWVAKLVLEADRLEVGEEELFTMIREARRNRDEDN